MPKFSIRDIILLTTVVGGFFGWTCDHGQLEARHQREIADLRVLLVQSSIREQSLQKRLESSIDLPPRISGRVCGLIRYESPNKSIEGRLAEATE